MINRRFSLLFIMVVGVIALMYFFLPEARQATKVRSPAGHVDRKQFIVGAGRATDLNVHATKEDLKKMKSSETPPQEWKLAVESALRVQGGNAIKDIKIEKIESYAWKHEGSSINAESILITLRNQNDELTKFKAMVDSHNGKILRTWDHPVIDPVNPRQNFGIKVDPRYHNN